MKVPKLGPKAFEQCAGFLRVPESKSVLDNTAVHPESYAAAEQFLTLTGHTLADVAAGKLGDLPAQVKAYGEEKAAEQCGVGVPTLRDVVGELMKPGRDIRDELPKPILRTDVLEMKDLKPGMVLTGTVRNVIDFGVFVDIGVHQDGLVHISQVADKFIRQLVDDVQPPAVRARLQLVAGPAVMAHVQDRHAARAARADKPRDRVHRLIRPARSPPNEGLLHVDHDQSVEPHRHILSVPCRHPVIVPRRT